MDKLAELEKLRAKVVALEAEIVPDAQAKIENHAASINALFNEITTLAKATKLCPTIQVGGNDITFDGHSWKPGYDSDWYSSSANC